MLYPTELRGPMPATEVLRAADLLDGKGRGGLSRDDIERKRGGTGEGAAAARRLFGAAALRGRHVRRQSFAAAAGCLDATVEAQAASAVDARALKLDDGRVLRLAGVEPFTLLLGDAAGAEEQARKPACAARRRRGAAASRSCRTKPDRYGRLPGPRHGRRVAPPGDACRRRPGARLRRRRPPPLLRPHPRGGGRGAERAARLLVERNRCCTRRPRRLQPRIGRFAIFEGHRRSPSARAARRPISTSAGNGRRT